MPRESINPTWWDINTAVRVIPGNKSIFQQQPLIIMRSIADKNFLVFFALWICPNFVAPGLLVKPSLDLQGVKKEKVVFLLLVGWKRKQTFGFWKLRGLNFFFNCGDLLERAQICEHRWFHAELASPGCPRSLLAPRRWKILSALPSGCSEPQKSLRSSTGTREFGICVSTRNLSCF